MSARSRLEFVDTNILIDLHRRHQTSFWDAMILQSAARLGCAVVWSEDLNAGQRYHDVQVLDPFS